MRQRIADARQLLENVEETRSQVARLRRSVRLLEEKCTGNITRYGRRGTPEGVGPEELWTKLCDRREKLTRQEGLLRDQEQVLAQWIDQLPRPRWRMVMRCRYLDGMSMTEIADELTRSTGREFSIHQVYRLHSAALSAAAELWVQS